MKKFVLIAFGFFIWFLGACSDPSGEINQGEIQRVQVQEEDASESYEHKDSLYHSTDNSEDLKALREAQKAIEDAYSGDAKAQNSNTAAVTNSNQDDQSGQNSGQTDNTANENKDDDKDPAATPAPGDGNYPVDYLTFTQSSPAGMSLSLASSASFMDATIADKNKFSVTIKAVKEFSGNITCSLEMEEWEVLDTNKDLKATLSPATFALKGEETQVVTISVDVGSYAPAKADQHMHLLCSSDNPNFKKMFNEEIKFSVEAVANIYMMGGVVEADQGEIWSTGRSKLNNDNMKFRQPVMLNFIVMDPSTESHRLHGDGIIPHQGNTSPVKGSPAYSVPVAAGVNNAFFYCHDHERGNLRQTVSVDAAPAN